MTNNLTPGERQVWAAVFAHEHCLIMREQIHARGLEDYNRLATELRRASVTRAAEAAAGAIVAMRRLAPAVREGWGETSETWTMLEEMVRP